MYVNYKLNDNETFEAYVFPNKFVDGLSEIEGSILNKSLSERKMTFVVKSDADGEYFEYEGNKVYIHKPIILSKSEIINLVNKEKEMGSTCPSLFSDELLVALIFGDEDFKFEAELPVFEVAAPIMGIGLTGDKNVKVPCELSEKRYKKFDWSYKVTLKVYDKLSNLSGVLASRDYYYEDFCQNILRGDIDIV